MTRTEALSYFNENYARPQINEKLFALDEYFHTNKDSLRQAFVESVREICLNIRDKQNKGEKGKIGFITYSMLRTALAEGKHTVLIEALNKDWFLDFEECQAEYDASWAFDFLDEAIKEFKNLIKPYMGNIVASDVDRIGLLEAAKFNQYIISLARYSMPEVILLKEFDEIDKEDELEIRVGEFRDMSEIVYKEDIREKDPVKIKEWLGEKLENEYSYEVFKNLDLSGGDYKCIDFKYTEFRNSNLSNSKFEDCVLVGTKFCGSNLIGTDFSKSFIHDANFSNCKLKGSVFYKAEGASGLIDRTCWEMPGFIGVNFCGADLEGVDFEAADLEGAVFIDANLKGVNFLGANLKYAVFLERDLRELDLDERQIKSIRLV